MVAALGGVRRWSGRDRASCPASAGPSRAGSRRNRRSSRRRPARSCSISRPSRAELRRAISRSSPQSGAYDGTTFHRVVKQRHGAGRRSAVERSGEAGAVRHRRTERGQGRAARAEDDARVGRRGARAGQAGQRRRAVLHRAGRSAGARRPVHRVRPRLGRHGRRCRRFRRRRSTTRGWRPSASRSGTSRSATRRRPPNRSSTRRSQELATIAPSSTRARVRSPSTFFPDKAPEHVRQFLRLAQAGVLRRHGLPSRRAGLRHSDRRAVVSRAAPLTDEAAGAGAQPAAGVQRHEARERIVSMARGDEPDERDDVVLHLHGAVAGARRQYTAFGRVVDGMAAGGRDRGGAAKRRGADRTDRSEIRAASSACRDARRAAASLLLPLAACDIARSRRWIRPPRSAR